MPLTKQRSYNVMQVAQIDEAPSTIGVADSELYLSSSLAEINARLDLMQSIGVTNVRIMVPWAGVQPLHPDTPFGLGNPRWEQLDMVVNAAAARGMGILGVMNSTPMWATTSTPINGQPADFDRFAAFAKSVALRYGSKISAYEVWNEPNSIQFWNTLDPAAYTEMLKKTYTALKEASVQIGSDITVIGGVIGAGKTWPGLTLNPIDFVRGMYEAGANGYFDALSFHPYNFEWKFSVGENLPWKEGMPLYQLNKIREMMDSYLTEGQEQVKIWITEYGAPTNKVSEATQAAFVRDLVEFWQTMPGAGPIFLYTIKDWLNPTADNDESNLGIFRPDGTMKPVGQVIKELIEALTNPTTPGPGTGPGTGPGAGAPAVNPFVAFLQAISQAFNGMFSALPNFFASVTSIFSNILGALFGIKPETPAAAAMSARAAVLSEGGVSEADLKTSALETSTGDEEGTEKSSGTEGVEQEIAKGVAVESVPAATVEPGTETVVVEAPVVEAPVVETPVVETPVVEEVTETETEPATQPEVPVSTDTEVDVVNEKVTDDAEGVDTGAPKKNGANSAPGKNDLATTDSSGNGEHEVRETSSPNLKSRNEQDARSPRGPRSGEAGQSSSRRGAASSARESSGTRTSSGADA